MPPLDHATLQAVLDKQGMPNTTENLNRIAQFAAVAPDMLEKYLGQGTDAARVGGGTDAAIDRSIASTADPRLAQLAGPNPYSATLDPNTGLTNIGPGLVKGPAEPRGGGGRAPSNAGKRGTNAVVDPDLLRPDLFPNINGQPAPAPAPTGGTTQGYESSTGAPMPVPSGAEASTQTPNGSNAGQGGGWTNYIVPSILALFAAQMARRGGGGTVAREAVGAVPTPTPTISNAIPAPVGEYGRPQAAPPTASVPTTPPPAMRQSDVSPAAAAQPQADVERMRAEVEAERKAAELRGEIKARAKRSGGGGGRTAP